LIQAALLSHIMAQGTPQPIQAVLNWGSGLM
jgi:hypothetical protein